MAKIPPEELERSGVRSNKASGIPMALLRRCMVWRDAPETDVETDGGKMMDVETTGVAKMSPEELERRGVRSNKNPGILRNLLRRCLTWRETPEDDAGADDVDCRR